MKGDKTKDKENEINLRKKRKTKERMTEENKRANDDKMNGKAGKEERMKKK